MNVEHLPTFGGLANANPKYPLDASSGYNKNFEIDDKTFGKYLSVTELSQALKSMKNNKTPGIDGKFSGITLNIL